MAKAMPFSALKTSFKIITANACWTGTRRDDTSPPKSDEELNITPRLPITNNCNTMAAINSMVEYFVSPRPNSAASLDIA
jgi:hypothetical protein